ncbi:MAG: carotenoid 1,2-hydratase, partial [Blastocatellia bacterium]|nr:carotenoid 1,2-hydratase [Blastocatellia bacterium]
SAREANGSHHLKASMGSDLLFEATLTPKKQVVLNGEKGVSFKDEGEASRYFSYTRMELEGDLTVDGSVEHLTGLAWMDREFGTWAPTERQKGWDWFSIQFNDQTELMCYQLRDSKNKISPFSSGVFVDKDGTTTRLSAYQIFIEPTGKWLSPGSGATYPSGWVVSVPSLGISANVQPVMKDQELDTRGTTMIVYWEGDCTVDATIGNRPVTGRSYVELVGYDRSHESPNLAAFLLGNRFGQ